MGSYLSLPQQSQSEQFGSTGWLCHPQQTFSTFDIKAAILVATISQPSQRGQTVDGDQAASL